MKRVSLVLLTLAFPFITSAAIENLGGSQRKTVGITTTSGERVAVDLEKAQKISDEIVSIQTFDGKTVDVTIRELSRGVSRRISSDLSVEELRLQRINERRAQPYQPGQRF